MTDRRLRLIYLGNAMQKGWGGRIRSPHVHSPEIYLMNKLSRYADISSVGLLPGELFERRFEPKDETPGLDHELFLWDKNPALWHRWISLRNLRSYYLQKVRQEGMPDVLVVRNLQPIYHYFTKWLRRQSPRPIIVLWIGDSGGLGEKFPWFRRFRYKFKPLQMLEEESALTLYDACMMSSITSRRFFEPRGVPCVWQPAVYKFEYTPPPPPPDQTGPIRFGFFGTLSPNYGVVPLVHAFLKANVQGAFHMCGCGDEASVELAKLAKAHPNFHFDGFLPKESDCLPWAQKMDVLINSRLPVKGQDNSFPSKIFEYGMAGKAILSTRTSGVSEVLKDEGIYFDTDNFEESVEKKIREVAAMDRAELQRRGQVIHDRVIKEYNADEQARRVAVFLDGLVASRRAPGAAG